MFAKSTADLFFLLTGFILNECKHGDFVKEEDRTPRGKHITVQLLCTMKLFATKPGVQSNF